MPRVLKYSLITVLVIFVLILSTMLIVPWQVRKQGTDWITENTSRSLQMEKVFFNPFTLTLEITAAELSEPGSSQPFVSFSRFLVSLSARSIIDRALILDRLEIDDPYVNINLLAEGKYNFSDFIPSEQATAQEPPAVEDTPFHFSLNNIIITNGTIDFREQITPNPAHHEIRQLSFSVPFIGNIPHLTDSYVTPQLFMFLNGSELKVNGQLKPFHNSLETDLYVSFHNVQLPFYANTSPVPLPVRVEEGSLDFEIEVTYIIADNEQPTLKVGGQFAISDLDIQEPDGSELLQIPTLLLGLREADIFKQDIQLEALEVYEPQIYVNRDQDGQLNLLQLFQAPVATTAETSTPEAEPVAEQPPVEGADSSLPWLLLVDKFKLADGRIHFHDDSVSGGLKEEIKAISINADQLSTHQDQQANISLSFASERQVSFTLNGQLGLNPVTADLDINLNDLPLEAYYPYLESLLTAPVAGQASVWGKVHYLQDGNVTLKEGLLSLNNLLVPFKDQDQFSLAALQLRDISLDLNQQQVRLGNLSLKDGDLKISRLADGSFSPSHLLRPATAAETPANDSDSSEPSPTAEPWKIELANFDLVNFSAAFQDQSLNRKPAARLKNLALHMENLSYPEAQQSPFSLSFDPGDHGNIHAQGSFVHTPLQLSSQLQVSELALNDYNRFIPENLALDLEDGRFFTALAVNLQQQEDSFYGDFSGTTDVSSFDLRDRRDKGRLISWQGLNVKGISGKLSPFALHIEDIALSDYSANIEISPEGQINLTSVNQVAAGETQEQIPEPTSETTEAQNATPADISINTVTMQGGTVRFTDRHLPSTFSTTMHELGGRISGLSSNQDMQADVDLRGNLENNSPLTVQGSINPLSKELFADLTISFNDIDLSPLTPYSGTYLGYAIDKGKLYLDLSYTIKHEHITASNRVMVDQFTFGESVKSDKATTLPVSLAIALLKNRNDEIHLNIPVSGDLNDPNFSIAGTIFTVLRNLLVKAATSPFSLLTAALGGGEDFSSISFAPGSTSLDPEQQTKLAELAEVLFKRPSLTLEISAFADRDNDPEAFRHNQLQQRLLDIKQRELEIKNSPEAQAKQLAITAEEYPELLAYAYKEATFPRPRTSLGTLKELPVEEMEKLLLSNILAGDEELGELAKQRALVVRDALQTLQPELKPRLFLKQTNIFQKPAEDNSASRVEFGINAK